MSFLKKVFGGTAAGTASAITDVAKDVADIVERWAPSDAAKHQMHMEMQNALAKAVAEARAYDPRTTGDMPFVQVFNALVDGISRLIRPGVTILLVGAVFGWWRIETNTLDPIVLSWSEIVIGFWFGMRAIVRDIPALIAMLVELRKKG